MGENKRMFLHDLFSLYQVWIGFYASCSCQQPQGILQDSLRGMKGKAPSTILGVEALCILVACYKQLLANCVVMRSNDLMHLYSVSTSILILIFGRSDGIVCHIAGFGYITGSSIIPRLLLENPSSSTCAIIVWHLLSCSELCSGCARDKMDPKLRSCNYFVGP